MGVWENCRRIFVCENYSQWKKQILKNKRIALIHEYFKQTHWKNAHYRYGAGVFSNQAGHKYHVCFVTVHRPRHNIQIIKHFNFNTIIYIIRIQIGQFRWQIRHWMWSHFNSSSTLNWCSTSTIYSWTTKFIYLIFFALCRFDCANT